MPAKGYDSVNLPTELYQKVKELIGERRDLGYRSVAEFVAESVRLRIEDIEVVGGLKSCEGRGGRGYTRAGEGVKKAAKG